jgi:hypothetical protein
MENNSRNQRDLTKNRHCDSLKKSQFSPSLGMMKKGDVVVIADDDDDEVKTTVSRH